MILLCLLTFISSLHSKNQIYEHLNQHCKLVIVANDNIEKDSKNQTENIILLYPLSFNFLIDFVKYNTILLTNENISNLLACKNLKENFNTFVKKNSEKDYSDLLPLFQETLQLIQKLGKIENLNNNEEVLNLQQKIKQSIPDLQNISCNKKWSQYSQNRTNKSNSKLQQQLSNKARSVSNTNNHQSNLKKTHSNFLFPLLIITTIFGLTYMIYKKKKNLQK